MAKYLAHKLTEAIKATQQDVENGVIGKYADASVIGAYFETSQFGGGEETGDILSTYAGDEPPTDGDYLKCDGSLIQDSEYPDLTAALNDGVVDRTGEVLLDGSFDIVTQFNVTTTSIISDIAVSPDNQYLAVTVRNSGTVYVYNVGSWTLAFDGSAAILDTMYSVDFSSDGQFMAVTHGSANRLTVFNTSDWSVVSGTPALTDVPTVRGLKFSPNRNLLAVGTYDNVNPPLVIIDTSNWTVLQSISVPSAVLAIDWSPDGKFVATGSTDPSHLNVVRTSDWTTVDNILVSGSTTVSSVSFSADGEYLAVSNASGTDALRLFRTSDWSEVDLDYSQASSNDAFFSNNGDRLISLQDDFDASIYRIADWSRYGSGLTGGSSVIFVCGTYSKDDHYIMAGTFEGDIWIFATNEMVPDGFTPLPNIPPRYEGNILIEHWIKA